MCYNVQSLLESQLKRAIQKHDHEAIAELREKLAIYGVENYYHTSGFQHKNFLLETKNGFKIAQWGLIPNWTPDKEFANDFSNKTINARIETAREKKAFRSAFQNGRSCIAVNGFFDYALEGKLKKPNFLYLQNQEPFYLATIEDEWVQQDTGEIINSFSILTRKGEGIIEEIHRHKEPRLPVMLEEKEIEDWLNDAISPTNSLHLRLEHHEVEPLSGKNYPGNSPEVSKPKEKDDEQLSLF